MKQHAPIMQISLNFVCKEIRGLVPRWFSHVHAPGLSGEEKEKLIYVYCKYSWLLRLKQFHHLDQGVCVFSQVEFSL